jgi:hypothetical protein
VLKFSDDRTIKSESSSTDRSFLTFKYLSPLDAREPGGSRDITVVSVLTPWTPTLDRLNNATAEVPSDVTPGHLHSHAVGIVCIPSVDISYFNYIFINAVH